jgi:D-aminoacyl-tRNA deacylase
MRVVLQRVARASVSVNAQVVGAIEHGVVLLVGVTHTDTHAQADWLAKKIAGLRIFVAVDVASGFDRSLQEVGGGVLCISQFTLYGETKKGRRPDFMQAAKPEVAAPLIDYFVAQLRAQGLLVQTGLFGADMQVALVNDGPVTLVLESGQIANSQ